MTGAAAVPWGRHGNGHGTGPRRGRRAGQGGRGSRFMRDVAHEACEGEWLVGLHAALPVGSAVASVLPAVTSIGLGRICMCKLHAAR